MNRSDLLILAESRLVDAQILLDSHRRGAAYYLLGYAVECALKACAAHQFRAAEIPDKAIVNDFYTHRLDKLLGISGVKAELENRLRTEPAFAVSWNTVREWNESSRYDHSISEAAAHDMLVAVADPHSGVRSWSKTVW